MVGQAKRCDTKIQRKAFGGDIFSLISHFYECRLEVADDVISCVAVD